MEGNSIVKRIYQEIIDWFQRIDKRMLFIVITVLTLAWCFCFPSHFMNVLFLIEVLCIGVYFIFITTQPKEISDNDGSTPTFTYNRLTDGFEVITPDENGKTLAELVIQSPTKEFQDLVDYLKNPEEFEEMDYKPETNLLLIGKNGYGKSALIKAFANDTQLMIIKINASRFFDISNIIETLFQFANVLDHYIIEIECFEKFFSNSSATTETPEAILDKLKTYLNFFDNVILVATCEDPTPLITDESYSGLFKKVIILDTPNQKERVKLLKEFSSHLNLNHDIDFEYIAKSCIGTSIGGLKYLVATAISVARKNKHETILQSDFFEAFDAIEFGNSDKKHSEDSRKIVAYHESGHALVRYLLLGKKSILRVISTSRGDTGGITFFSPDDDKVVYTKQDLINEICAIYGGRCAEKLVFHHVSTGASADIQRASSIISSMVQRYGMSDKIGPLDVSPKIALMAVLNESSDMRNLISQECLKLSQECEQKTLKLLESNRNKLDILASYLIEHESITGDEIEEILKNT